MTLQVGVVLCGDSYPNWPGMAQEWFGSVVFENHDNSVSPCAAYQECLERSTADILLMLHSDVDILDENWKERILTLFESNYNCVAVGFGGATSLGNADLLRKPYNIWNLARGGYASNQVDAETHGERFAGDRRVVVLEQFAMAVRTEWLRRMGGWPVQHIRHHCLDLWLACEAARDGKEIFMTGVSVNHRGGGVSVRGSYATAPWLDGGSQEEDHRRPHRWLLDHYLDQLPLSMGKT